MLAVFPHSSAAQERPAFITRPDEDLLLFRLELGDMTLTEAISAYQSGSDLLLPLDELARLVSIGVRVDVVAGTADGFIRDEGSRFFLDARRGTVLFEGQQQTLPPSSVEIHRDDIYVPIRLLAEWLAVDFEVVLLESRLVIHSRKPLPIEERRDRAERGKIRGEEEAPLRFPVERTPYDAFGLPAIDYSAALLYEESTGETEGRLSTRMTGDLLRNEFDFFAAASGDEVEETRFTLGRRDPNGTLLGPLGAREVLAGTIYYQGSDLLGLGTLGEGVLISNYPLRQLTRFDRYTFRGALPTGWDVELYRNDVLIGFARSRADGLYEFLDVPMLFGVNLFRLVFYGPQGQRREEQRRFNIAESFAPQGKAFYRIVANQPDSGDDYVTAEMDYGLTRRFTAIAGLTRFASGEKEGISIAKLGLAGFFGSYAARLEGAADSEGEAAGQVTLQGRLRSTSISLQHAELGDFAGTLAESFLPRLRSRSLLRVDGALPSRFALNIPYGLEARRETYPDEGVHSVLLGRVGTAFRGVAATLELDGNWYEEIKNADQFTARLLFNRRVGAWLYRAAAEYQMDPSDSFRSAEALAERRFGNGWFTQLSVRRFLLADSNLLGFTLGRSEGAFGLSAQANWSDQTGFIVNAIVSGGAIVDRFSGLARTDSRATASYGYIAARVFVDEDRDGRFGPGDAPIEGATLFVNRRSVPGRTDANGFLLVGEVPVYEAIEVALNSGSLEDPLLAPTREGTAIIPRPGNVVELEFPVTLASEIAGTVVLDDPRTGPREIAGVRVALLDGDGTVVAEAVSSFDGFFEILGIAPGTYALTVHPEQSASSGLRATEARTIRLEPGDVIDRIRLVITR